MSELATARDVALREIALRKFPRAARLPKQRALILRGFRRYLRDVIRWRLSPRNVGGDYPLPDSGEGLPITLSLKQWSKQAYAERYKRR